MRETHKQEVCLQDTSDEVLEALLSMYGRSIHGNLVAAFQAR